MSCVYPVFVALLYNDYTLCLKQKSPGIAAVLVRESFVVLTFPAQHSMKMQPITQMHSPNTHARAHTHMHKHTLNVVFNCY